MVARLPTENLLQIAVLGLDSSLNVDHNYDLRVLAVKSIHPLKSNDLLQFWNSLEPLKLDQLFDHRRPRRRVGVDWLSTVGPEIFRSFQEYLVLVNRINLACELVEQLDRTLGIRECELPSVDHRAEEGFNLVRLLFN
jgi:hypothetical protein